MAEERVVRVRRNGVARPQLTRKRPRPGTWTPKKREAFLAELASCANVRASAKAVGMVETTAYRLRARDPEFRAAWAAALCEGYAKLEMMLLERAMKGTPRLVKVGEKVSRTRDYSDRLIGKGELWRRWC